MIYSLFTRSRICYLRFSIIQIGQLLFGQTEKAFFQRLPLTYMNENGVLRGCFRKRFTTHLQNIAVKKTSSTYTHKNSGLPPCLEKCLPCIYKNPILQQRLSPNSHRKLKTAPSFKNSPHLIGNNGQNAPLDPHC